MAERPRIILTPDEAAALRRLAQADGVTVGEVLRRGALSEAVRRGLWPPRREEPDATRCSHAHAE